MNEINNNNIRFVPASEVEFPPSVNRNFNLELGDNLQINIMELPRLKGFSFEGFVADKSRKTERELFCLTTEIVILK